MGGKESSELGTPLLLFKFASGHGAAAPFDRGGVPRRHRPGRIQQIAQRHKPLGRRPRLVQRDLLSDALVKWIIACGHPLLSYWRRGPPRHSPVAGPSDGVRGAVPHNEFYWPRMTFKM